MTRQFLMLGTATYLSAVLLGGCSKTDSADTTAPADNPTEEEINSAPLIHTIDGEGIQHVKLNMPGMT